MRIQSTITKKEDMPQLLSAKELKKFLGCSNKTAYTLCRQTGFPSFRINTRYYIPVNLLGDWVHNQVSEYGHRILANKRCSKVKSIEEVSELLSAKEIKVYLSCGDNTVYSLLNRQDFPVMQINKKKYVPVDKFMNWIYLQTKLNKI